MCAVVAVVTANPGISSQELAYELYLCGVSTTRQSLIRFIRAHIPEVEIRQKSNRSTFVSFYPTTALISLGARESRLGAVASA